MANEKPNQTHPELFYVAIMPRLGITNNVSLASQTVYHIYHSRDEMWTYTHN